jgi:hypothetical protein
MLVLTVLRQAFKVRSPTIKLLPTFCGLAEVAGLMALRCPLCTNVKEIHYSLNNHFTRHFAKPLLADALLFVVVRLVTLVIGFSAVCVLVG